MNRIERFFRLQALPAFQMLRVSELGVIAEAVSDHDYSPGRVIATAGNPLPRLIIAASGGLQTADGAALPPMIGIPSLLYDRPLAVDILTAPDGPTLCLTMQKRHFFTLINECPAFLVRASETMEPQSLYRECD